MSTTIIISTVSVWLIVVLFLCALVRSGAIREREQYDRLVVLRDIKGQSESELNYWGSVKNDGVKSVRADWPEIHDPAGRNAIM